MYQSWPAFGPSSEPRRHRAQVFSLHAKGKRILDCGCDTSLLVGSTCCVEMNPDQAKRAEQARLTESIHAQYPDFIAPCSGHERSLTVSSSHVSQFFKAKIAGCKSPGESLVGPKTGKMSISSISDRDFLQACNEGWTWTVIPFYLEASCFWFIDFRNKVFHRAWSQLFLSRESMFCFLRCWLPRKAFLLCQLWYRGLWMPPTFVLRLLEKLNSSAQLLPGPSTMDAGKLPDFAKLAELSAAGSVAAYADVLGKFVQCFGGGSPWEAIKYLSTFSMVDKSVSLGKEDFQVVTEADFSSASVYPLLRLGFLCCNLTAPEAKIQDGFARLLSKSDVISCTVKKWRLYWKIWRREWRWTKLSSKQMRSKPLEDFKSDLCCTSSKRKNQVVKASSMALSWTCSTKSCSKRLLPVLPVLLMALCHKHWPWSRPKIQCLKLKLELGEVCAHKNHPGKLFKITKVDGSGVQIQYQDPMTSYEVPEVVEMVKNAKGKIPQMMDAALLEAAFPVLFAL